MDDIIAACMGYEGSLTELLDFPSSDVPVWIMGNQYSTDTQLEEIRSDVRSKCWMTYRRNFPQIKGTEFTSDKGWGCMLRCGQMVFAESLIRHHLGRDWRWSPEEQCEDYWKIISSFEDDSKHRFSIHSIAQQGLSFDKPIGEWYGPNTIAQVLKKITPVDDWNCINVHVVMDNAFIINEIRKQCSPSPNKGFEPLLLFVPLRLGVTEINSIYFSGLKKSFRMPQSLGIIGGKPNHALYFIGFMGDEIVYLDPHTTQDSGTFGDKETEEAKNLDLTYHCYHSLRMPFEYIDPSLSLCFFCATEKDFDDLCNRLQQDIIDSEKSPILELYSTRPSYLVDNSEEVAGAVGLELDDHNLYSDDDDFEVLE